MTTVDPLIHMEEAWKLDSNPLPKEAIRVLGQHDQPYSPDVFPDEAQEFRQKFARSMLLGSTKVGFLWSQGVNHDTGFGKTTLMQAIRNEINVDLGLSTLEKSGLKADRIRPIAAALTNLNTLQATGLYPVLFYAAVDLAASNGADGLSVMDLARKKITERIGADDPSEITENVRKAWLKIAPGGTPLRPELIEAFSVGGASGVSRVLQQVSEATRLRGGLQYLDFVLAVLAAANIQRLILMVDQLEDLATNRAISSAKRSKEIGRIRDLLEQPPYATFVRLVFTFHNRAAGVLERFWEDNRLPRFEVTPDNMAAMVVLRGLHDDEKAAKLLGVYLQDSRTEEVEDEILPFDMDAVRVLRAVAEDRPGHFLGYSSRLLDYAALENAPRITGELARGFLKGEADTADIRSEMDVADDDVDDVLLG
jgi:hypothetical protein